MTCFRPLHAYRTPGGGVTLRKSEGYIDRPALLPCGYCLGCRERHAQDWSVRCVHEAQMHERNSFVTLTYDQEHLPEDLSVDVRHWQLFAKRLRLKIGPFRFFHCGEYGEKTLRPHYHALIFGEDFSFDRFSIGGRGKHDYFSSPTLSEVWGKGFCVIGNLSVESARYVARYALKKEVANAPRYERVDKYGELSFVRREYVTMSRRPGLGSSWFDRFGGEVFPADEVVHEGRTYRPARFYDERLGSEELESVKRKRRLAADAHADDLTVERLADRESVAKSRLALLSRS